MSDIETFPIRRTSLTLARPDYSALRALGGYLYLATPYTNYNGGGAMGRDMAYRAAAQLAGELRTADLRIFSPIEMGHPISGQIGFDALTHRDWLEIDGPFMARASGLIVAMMQGWRESSGVQYEIAIFDAAGKPIFFLDCDSREIIQHVAARGQAPGAGL